MYISSVVFLYAERFSDPEASFQRMEIVTICLIIFVLVSMFPVAARILSYWKYLRKMKKLPTVGCHPILGHLSELIFVPKKREFENIVNVMTRSPSCSVLWIGPLIPIVIFYKAEHNQKILSSATNNQKSALYWFFQPWLGDGLFTSKGEKWRLRRKLTTPAFHFKILESFLEVFAENTQIIVKKLENELSSKCFDIFPYVSAWALDMIIETAMGSQINAQQGNPQGNPNLEYLKAVKSMTDGIPNRVKQPWLYPDFIFFLTPTGRQFKKDAKTAHDFTNRIIQEKRLLHQNNKCNQTNEDLSDLGIKKRKVFIDILLEASENNHQLSDEDIRDEVETFIFAGHDTVASAISFALRELSYHPEVQDKIVEEQKEIFQGSFRTPSVKDLSEMKYLEMVINECLRLHPPGIILARETTEDLEIDGLHIPAGTTIGTSIYLTHRDPEQYPNPNNFNPENFLPDRVAKRNQYAFLPFSGGLRNCIGQKYAMMEMKVMLSFFLRHYVVEEAGDKPIVLLDLIMNSLNGVQVKIKKRTF